MQRQHMENLRTKVLRMVRRLRQQGLTIILCVFEEKLFSVTSLILLIDHNYKSPFAGSDFANGDLLNLKLN